jgi:hypothetical protein
VSEKYKMETSRDKFDPSRILSRDKIVEDAEKQLYNVRLLCKKLEQIYEPRNHRYYRYFIIFICIIFGIRCVASVYFYNNEEASKILAIYFGDFTYFIPQVRFHFNLLCIAFAVLDIVCYIIFNCSKDLPWLNIFVMMKGLITPASIDLTTEQQITSLIKRTKLIFILLSPVCNIIIPLCGFLYAVFIYAFNYKNILLFILLEIPWCGLLGFWGHFCSNGFWIIGYFHIICYYHKLKLRYVNSLINKLTKIIRIKRPRKLITKLLKQINDIYLEIAKNNKFWCKIIFIVYICYLSVISGFLYQIIYGHLDLFLDLTLGYLLIVNCIIFLVLLLSAQSVCNEAFNSCKIFNSLFLNTKNISGTIKFKVLS